MHVVAVLAALTLHAGSDEAMANAGRTAPLAERTLRVGPIFISGADDMSASAILNALGFHYGDEDPLPPAARGGAATGRPGPVRSGSGNRRPAAHRPRVGRGAARDSRCCTSR